MPNIVYMLSRFQLLKQLTFYHLDSMANIVVKVRTVSVFGDAFISAFDTNKKYLLGEGVTKTQFWVRLGRRRLKTGYKSERRWG